MSMNLASGFRSRHLLLLALLCLLPASFATAYSSNTWRNARSDHFVVSYSKRTKELVQPALTIAEQTIGTLTEYFGHMPKRRISIVLADDSDDSNGWTSDRDSWIWIDCRNVPSLYRRQADWLRTVLSHELSHLYSLKVLNPPIVLETYLGVESQVEGFQFGARQYWGMNAVPLWFIEGIAQLGSNRFQADSWDPLREMVLKDAVLSDSLLPLSGMARFEGTGREYELVYNQGFSFLLHLQEVRAAVSIKDLCRSIRTRGFGRAFLENYGESVQKLHDEWRGELQRRYADQEAWVGGRRLSQVDAGGCLEVASAQNGRFIIANWGNDYSRFSLFKKRPSGRYACVARDTGTVLREDPVTREIWFNRPVYNHQTGVDNYEVFRIKQNGRITRVTRVSRCLAFDVFEGHLLYSRYVDGRTQLVQRRPDGTEALQYEFGRETAIYSLSLVSREVMLLCLGTPEGPRLAVLAEGRLRYLWKGYEILEAVFAGAGRVVFTGTLDGVPQIYWADLEQDARAWYQLTAAPAGARFPTFEENDGQVCLCYSVYERGCYRRYSLQDAFPADRPVQLAETAIAEAGFPRELPNPEPVQAAVLNPVEGSPVYYLSLTSNHYLYGSQPAVDWTVGAGLSGSIYNAPSDLGLDYSLGLSLPLFLDVTLFPWIDAELLSYYGLGPLKAELNYYFALQTYYEAPYKYSNVHHEVYLEGSYQLHSRHFLQLHYDLSWHVDTSFQLRNVYLLAQEAGLRCWFQDSRRSVFDPAHLGQPFLSLYAGADLRWHRYPEPAYFDPLTDYLDPHLIYELLAGIGARFLPLAGKLSCAVWLDAFSYFGGLQGDRLTPYLLPSIGGADLLSGYPAGYAEANDLLLATFEVATNPLVTRNVRTAWYERLRLGAIVGAGLLRYPDSGLQLALPVSLEMSLRYYFFPQPNRQGQFYIRVGVPLNEFNGKLNTPFQLYLGISS